MLNNSNSLMPVCPFPRIEKKLNHEIMELLTQMDTHICGSYYQHIYHEKGC